jgi:hypothetical protein
MNTFNASQKINPPSVLVRGLVFLLVTAIYLPLASAQSVDALIDKLEKKGVLTAQEATELRQEARNQAPPLSQFKNALPDWVTSFKLNGDFRGRYEGHYADNDDFVDRHRYRYRVRIGITATLLDDFEFGLRLGSGDPVSGFSNNAGNPLSGNSTLQDNGTRKFIYIDLAYAKWTPLHTPDWSGTITLGKMELPFVFSHVVFDPDYNPEGLAGQMAYTINDHHAVKLNLGAFILDELAATANDPFLLGAQLRFDSKWTKKIVTSVGVSALGISAADNLNNSNVPNVNRGNTRGTDGAPAFNFSPIVADAWLTYTLDRFPGYAAAFPIKVGGEFLYNPSAPDRNEAFTAGVTFGKAGKKGLWEISYAYRYLGADSWYEELPDDDFGAFYQMQQPNAGFISSSNPVGAGFGGGTNVRGHVVKASYSPYNSLTLSLTFYYGSLIDASPSGSDSDVGHLLADIIWRF